MTMLGEIIPMALVAGGIIFLVILIIKKRGSFGFSFQEVSFSDATYKPLKENIKLNGQKVRGSLYFGYATIHNITRFAEFKGELPVMSYDEDNNVYLDEGESKEHDLLSFEISNGILSKVFGIGREYYILDKNNIKIRYDGPNARWFLPAGITWYSYGDLWIADSTTKDFVRNLSVGFMDESVQTHLINNPNRVVALDLEHAKKVNVIYEAVKADSTRYRDPERASESETK